MCIDDKNFRRVNEAYCYIKNKMYLIKREILCCFGRKLKRKNSDPITSFYNPYYDPEFTELKEVIIVPNEQISDKIIYTQPNKLNMSSFASDSDDEIVFEKNTKHLIEINEDNTFNQIFNNQKSKEQSYNINLSTIPEDIDSSMERRTPDSPVKEPFISSPHPHMEFDDLQEEIKCNLSKSNLSITSVNIGEEDEDNWDLLT